MINASAVATGRGNAGGGVIIGGGGPGGGVVRLLCIPFRAASVVSTCGMRSSTGPLYVRSIRGDS